MANEGAIVIGLLGAAVVVAGLGVVRGHLWLLANYDPDAVDDRQRVGRLAGSIVVAFGLLTLGFTWGLASGRADDWWWTGWALAALVLGGAAALVASGRR